MRSAPMMAMPLALLLCASVHADVFRCTAAGKVEYRNFPCDPRAEQRTIIVTHDLPQGATPADPAAALARLRQADQALSERLARERELHMQIAAQQDVADQQAQTAREAAAAERRYSENAGSWVGVYWPYAGHWRRHSGGRGHMVMGPLRPVRQHWAKGH